MAVTPGVINGTIILVYVATHAIAASQSCSLSQTTDVRDTTNKDSGGYKCIAKGLTSWSMECSGLVVFDQTYGLAWLNDAYAAGTPVAVKMGTANSSDYYWNGTALITSFKMDAPTEQNTTFSVTFTGTGALTWTKPGA